MEYQKVPLPNYPGYFIDTNGCVYNKWGRELQGGTTRGYRYVSITIAKYKVEQFAVHRLVASTFIPNPENKPTVDHIDRDRSNNSVSNLRWATMVEQNINKTNIRLHRSNETGIHFSNGYYHVLVLSNNEKSEAFFSSLDDAKIWYEQKNV